MQTRKTIRHKLLIAVAMLASVVIMLAYSALKGVEAYRDLARMISSRATELPVTSELIQAVDELRFSHRPSAKGDLLAQVRNVGQSTSEWGDRFRFRDNLTQVRECLAEYTAILDSKVENDLWLGDRSEERRTVRKIRSLLTEITKRQTEIEINQFGEDRQIQTADLNELSKLAHTLPTFLQQRLKTFRDEVRSRYRTWFFVDTVAFVLSAGIIIGLCVYARKVVLVPFKKLLYGSRRVASGEFTHRIEMDQNDELGELANAINMGTESFLRIEKDLYQQVRERSREVIRNEQLASVGFLAAGVAHEINNPLASIAWSAEALETRLHRLLKATDFESLGVTVDSADPNSPDKLIEIANHYLTCIQNEAFRCKGITERLLNFARLGQAEKKMEVDLKTVVEEVIDMVKHLGQYRNRKIDASGLRSLQCWASPQEMKQVILNLLTNALDSIYEDQADGCVRISIDAQDEFLRLRIEDNGCGMKEDVLEHVFEPFFTQRLDGRGTGLGLPITSRIVADHGGRISCSSGGEGHGSKFEVLIPLRKPEVQHERQLQAA